MRSSRIAWAIALVTSGCCLPGFGRLTAVPARPNLPSVAFVAPGDARAVACLTQDNADNLLEVELVQERHVLLLEQIIHSCR